MGEILFKIAAYGIFVGFILMCVIGIAMTPTHWPWFDSVARKEGREG